MKDVIKIEAPPEASPRSQFMEYLTVFLTDRHRAEVREEILDGKPWEDETVGRYYFRLQDFQKFLEREKFDEYARKRNKIASELRQLGGKDFFNIRGRGTNVLYVEKKYFEVSTEPSPLPRNQGIPI